MARSGGGFWKGVFFMLFLAALGCGCLALVIQFGGFPMGADAQPPGFEAQLGAWARGSWVDNHAPDVADPVPVNDDTLMAGAALYQGNCAVCHGGENYKKSPLHQGVYPGAPQFMRSVEFAKKHPQAAMHHGTPAQEQKHYDHSFFVIKHGIRFTGMPAWKYKMSDTQIWEVVNFMHSMDHLPPKVGEAWKRMPLSPIPQSISMPPGVAGAKSGQGGKTGTKAGNKTGHKTGNKTATTK